MNLIDVLLPQFPRLLLTLIALTVAITLVLQRRAQLGNAGQLALIGFALLFACTVGQTAFFTWMQVAVPNSTFLPVTWIYTAANLLFAVVEATAIVLLGVAFARKMSAPAIAVHELP